MSPEIAVFQSSHLVVQGGGNQAEPIELASWGNRVMWVWGDKTTGQVPRRACCTERTLEIFRRSLQVSTLISAHMWGDYLRCRGWPTREEQRLTFPSWDGNLRMDQELGREHRRVESSQDLALTSSWQILKARGKRTKLFLSNLSVSQSKAQKYLQE